MRHLLAHHLFVESLHLAQHLLFPGIRTFANGPADHVVAQVGELCHTVEDPECGGVGVFQHAAVLLAETEGHFGRPAIDRRESRGGRIVHAEPKYAAYRIGQVVAGLCHEPETGLLRSGRAFVRIGPAFPLPLHRSPAVRAGASARSDVGGHVQRGAFVVVAHGVEHLLGRYFLRGFYPQGHPVVGIMPHRIVRIGVHTRSESPEERPYTGFAAAHGAEIERGIRVAEAELLVAPAIVSHFAGE